ncbi:MAG: MspA family porin [Segniliparus sp.]|uniref:MspA family porin n=1 Tax=Segniliparus sp. TaxID=2804064 RepID=UPI003F3092BA
MTARHALRSSASRHVRRALSAVFCALGSGALMSSPSEAEVLELEDVAERHVTDDGYRVTLVLSEQHVDSVPNMASTLFTREAFVSAKASVKIAGKSSVPMDSGLVKLGVQASCQMDLSNGVKLNARGDLAWTSPSATAGIGNNVLNLNSGNVRGAIGGGLDAYLRPGQIATVPVAVKRLSGRAGATRAINEHLNVDSCGGSAYVRAYAVVQVSTAANDDMFTVYGPITQF